MQNYLSILSAKIRVGRTSVNFAYFAHCRWNHTSRYRRGWVSWKWSFWKLKNQNFLMKCYSVNNNNSIASSCIVNESSNVNKSIPGSTFREVIFLIPTGIFFRPDLKIIRSKSRRRQIIAPQLTVNIKTVTYVLKLVS